MKIPKLPRPENRGGFTLIELLVVISIIAILAGFALPVFTSAQKKGRISNTLNNAHQIGLALKLYAGDHDGNYPLYQDPNAATPAVATTANEALQSLLPKYSSAKDIFGNKLSAWCKQTAGGGGNNDQNKLNSGECDWVFVRGLSETADSRSPLLATAFMPGAVTYSKKTTEKGGVWAGTDAVVVFVDHSAKQFSDLKDDGGNTTFIRRTDKSDKKNENMFTFDSDWVGAPDGDNGPLVLHPSTGS